MQCPSCKARIGDTSNFCRYCGNRVFRKPTAALSTERGGYGAAAAAAPRKATDVTIKLKPGFYPIPKRFEKQLNSGTRPEAVISELLRQKAEMRNLLESIARSDDSKNPSETADVARKFLLSHCIVCGDSVERLEAGRTPVCKQCAALP